MEFQELMVNIDIVIEDWPSKSQLRKLRLHDKYELLGLYEGVPLTKRDQGYNLVLPDKITIFQKPIESHCRSSREIKNEIVRVVRHEIAHHFGMDDDKLYEIENGKNSGKPGAY
ncbi:MAG: metallopeptidase family protein [Chloroflexi bacterium]|nr:metallopeptidase family protein [Chloroflexota bacterium]